jgi:hypothetical protein
VAIVHVLMALLDRDFDVTEIAVPRRLVTHAGDACFIAKAFFNPLEERGATAI